MARLHCPAWVNSPRAILGEAVPEHLQLGQDLQGLIPRSVASNAKYSRHLIWRIFKSRRKFPHEAYQIPPDLFWILIWHAFSFYPKAVSGWWPDRKAGSVEHWLSMRTSCRGFTSDKCIQAEFRINQFGVQWGKESFMYRGPVSAARHP